MLMFMLFGGGCKNCWERGASAHTSAEIAAAVSHQTLP